MRLLYNIKRLDFDSELAVLSLNFCFLFTVMMTSVTMCALQRVQCFIVFLSSAK